MAELVPMPMDRLLTRMMREYEQCSAVFDLPVSRGFFGSADHDFTVAFHGRPASSPLGPAAGPQSQMAQNIVLAWLGGSRIMELKTVQVLDELTIARPCIDMRTAGYNIEWSQELKLEQSAEEYVKGAMLVEILRARLGDQLVAGFCHTIYDMSVGYDLTGIQDATVRRFIETMMDASTLVERLRDEIPDAYAAFKDLPFPTKLSDTLTLSTFHGCPPDEIERILEFLMREYGLNVIVKLNPTLLGPDEVDHLLHDVLGYDALRVPATAFTNDTTWEQACGFTERLGALAASLGVGFGVKLTNTLIIEHDGEFIPSDEKEKYLSGPPLHVLSMKLVERFREQFGVDLPISFSAGIDARNFPDAVALGLTPITVCTDLLRPRGYARQATYFKNLMQRMDAVNATTINGFIGAINDASNESGGRAEAVDRSRAILANTTRYVAQLTADPRYTLRANTKPPTKIGSSLVLFNCITCDKCIPACPNDAVFTIPIPEMKLPTFVCRLTDDIWHCEPRGTIDLTEHHQIATFADFCNDCGNCDVFCPEDGGPQNLKPRFFGSEQAFEQFSSLDGFHIYRDGETVHVRGRFDLQEYSLAVSGRTAIYVGGGFEIEFSLDDPAGTMSGRADPGLDIDLSFAIIMDLIQRWVLDEGSVNYINAAQ